MKTALLVLVHLGPATWGVYHVLLYKRDPRAAMGWIMACIFIPYAGPIAYFLFGINRVRSRARGMQSRMLSVGYEYGTRPDLDQDSSVKGIRDAGRRITGRALINGNAITPLYNGDQAYPAMLDSIAKATERVYLATYIMKMDDIGKQFSDALHAAVLRGVDVRVLVDGFGEWYSWPHPSRILAKRGIQTARFLPPRLLPPSIYLNLRNHRKMLIVDHDVAYAGGMNIGDENRATGNETRRITDVHFALRGPVIADLADLYLSDWYFANGGKNDTPPRAIAAACGESACRVVPDGPDEELDSLSVTLQTVISTAQHAVDIMTPYFLPNRELMASLESAVLRGVRVRIVLPKKNNLFFVHWAHSNTLVQLLRWDIEAWYQPAPFCHAKLLCIDDEYSLIGSANLDSRSLRLNFELGVEIFSTALNRELREHFDKIIDASRRITYDELANRPVARRLRDSAAALFAPYL